MKRILKVVVVASFVLVAIFGGWVYYVTWHPSEREAMVVSCDAGAPLFDAGQPLKVMVYNVQYFAGKDYVFYYDLPDGVGPDRRPGQASVERTLDGIADLIRQHNPDVVLLQEVNDGSANTDYHDQTQQLLQRLEPGHYPCYTDAFYWKARYVPIPEIMGSVGMKLVTLSRFQLDNAWRLQLPLMPNDLISRQFYLKRALLSVEMPSQDGASVTLINTHLDAFAQGSDTMEQQVAMVVDELKALDQQQQPWLIGGDFNLLAPGQFDRLDSVQQAYYREPTELKALLRSWSMVPSLADINAEPEAWYTHYPNDPRATGPDRTIDYLFYSRQWQVLHAEVLNDPQALSLSDHLPIQVVLELNPDEADL